jgi:hypothetical protein
MNGTRWPFLRAEPLTWKDALTRSLVGTIERRGWLSAVGQVEAQLNLPPRLFRSDRQPVATRTPSACCAASSG